MLAWNSVDVFNDCYYYFYMENQTETFLLSHHGIHAQQIGKNIGQKNMKMLNMSLL